MAAMLSKAQQKRIGAVGASAGGSTVEVATAAEDELGDGEDPPVVTTTLMLPPGYAAIALLLKAPPPLADDWVPLEEASKYLPKKCAQDLEKLQAELADQRSLVDLQARKVVTVTPAELLAAKKKVETIEKNRRAESRRWHWLPQNSTSASRNTPRRRRCARAERTGVEKSRRKGG